MRKDWLSDPLALDVSFQLIILWCIEQRGAGSLPCFAGRYRQFRAAFPEKGVRIVAQVKSVSDHLVRADVDFLDADGVVVARMEDCESVISASLQKAFRRNHLKSEGLGSSAVSPAAHSLPKSGE